MRRSTALASIVVAALVAGAPPASATPVTGTPQACPPAAPAVPAASLAAVAWLLGGAGEGPAECPAVPAPAPGEATTAAERHGWGEPVRADEFDGAALGDAWEVYDGPGHAGNGRRTPDAVTVRDGILTITGDSRGDTAGMAWNPGQKYGRWEARVKAPASDESYNALLLLWPDAENFPVGGEIDFMEMMDHTRQETDVYLHYGEDNDTLHGKVTADGTQWNNWAVEWTPTHVATFLNGEEWWRTDRADVLPPGPMHLCIQLDWFPKHARGSIEESTMQVDWVKQYAVDPAQPDEDADPR